MDSYGSVTLSVYKHLYTLRVTLTLILQYKLRVPEIEMTLSGMKAGENEVKIFSNGASLAYIF